MSTKKVEEMVQIFQSTLGSEMEGRRYGVGIDLLERWHLWKALKMECPINHLSHGGK